MIQLFLSIQFSITVAGSIVCYTEDLVIQSCIKIKVTWYEQMRGHLFKADTLYQFQRCPSVLEGVQLTVLHLHQPASPCLLPHRLLDQPRFSFLVAVSLTLQPTKEKTDKNCQLRRLHLHHQIHIVVGPKEVLVQLSKGTCEASNLNKNEPVNQMFSYAILFSTPAACQSELYLQTLEAVFFY